MDIAVLGHRGMLGSVVARYFTEQGANVLTTDMRYDGSDSLPYWAARAELVVNCIAGGPNATALLPGHLVRLGCRLIQPSTDAWKEDTLYARLKRLGEPTWAIVTRCGLIDVERQPTFAFTNWYCNPLTPLEWAFWAWQNRQSADGLYYLGRERVTRADIARAVHGIFGGVAPVGLDYEESNDRVQPDTTQRLPLNEALKDYAAWLRS